LDDIPVGMQSNKNAHVSDWSSDQEEEKNPSGFFDFRKVHQTRRRTHQALRSGGARGGIILQEKMFLTEHFYQFFPFLNLTRSAESR